jgi:hypothetical protein
MAVTTPWSKTFAIVLLLATTSNAAEPPAITGVFPPGGQVGTDLEVAIKGKPGDGNLQVWSEQQKLSFVFSEKKDKATIKIPVDTQPGIHWLRFYNEFGTTDLRPFFIGTLSELADTEPNNELTTAQKIEGASATVNGVLHTTGEVDLFSIDLDADQMLVASVQANRELASPMDGVLQLLDPDGTVVASNDDDHANDPLAMLTAPSAGTYFVRLFAFPAAPNSTIRLHGAASYVYRLTMTTGPFQNHVATRHLELTEDPDQREPFPIPWTVTGRISEPKEADEYSFGGTKGQNINVSVAARAHFSQLDPFVVLRSQEGKVIKEFDDRSGSDPDVDFSVALPEDGRYVLIVKDRYGNGGERFDYVASVKQNQPHFSAAVAANQFVLPTEKPLELPVAIARANGFAERIAVTVEGLPEGVTVAPVLSEKEGDSSKSVTLKLERTEAAKGFTGVIRVVCTAESTKQLATAPRPNSKARIDQLWLTVAQ